MFAVSDCLEFLTDGNDDSLTDSNIRPPWLDIRTSVVIISAHRCPRAPCFPLDVDLGPLRWLLNVNGREGCVGNSEGMRCVSA